VIMIDNLKVASTCTVSNDKSPFESLTLFVSFILTHLLPAI